MEIQWPLVIFTLCVCLGAGLFALQGLLCVLGKGEKTQIPAVIVAAIAVIVGGFASFMHLEHWDRAFNGFGQLSSGITQELIGVGVLFIVMAIFFAAGRKALAPKWVGALAILAALLALVLMTTSYMMPARPVWNNPLLYVFYFGQAFVAGAGALWTISSLRKEEQVAALAAKCTAVGGVVVILSLALYAAFIGTISFANPGNYLDMTMPTAPPVNTSDLTARLVGGDFALAFWIALIVGGVVPALLGFLKWKSPQINLPFAALCTLCALAGGFAFRAVIYLLGFSVYPIF